MKDGEFRLDFRIPISQGTISNVDPVKKVDDLNGIITLSYDISLEDDNNGEIDI